jgi:hypothetical protein
MMKTGRKNADIGDYQANGGSFSDIVRRIRRE